MIAKMSKYDLVLYAAQSDDFIARLRELGLVDITTTGWEPAEEDRQLLLDIEGHGRAAEFLSGFRTFSKNIPQRERENEAWLNLIAKPKETISLARKAWANRATTKYFRCKGCGAALSVPKRKGKLRVTCPKCHWQTEKKS